MSRSPHPAFARLHALGGAPARAAAYLAGALPALTALVGDLDGLDLLSDRAIAPLTREIDLGALLARGLARGGTEAAPGGPAGEAGRRPATTRREPRPAPVEPIRPVRKNARRREEQGRPAPAGRREGTPAPALEPERVAAALARHAPAGTERSKNGGSQQAEARRAMPAKQNAAAPAGARILVDSAPPASGPSRPQAVAALRARAERAGGPAAADTPVALPQVDPEVEVLLARAAGGGRETTGEPPAAVATPHPKGGAEPAAQGPALLARALDRLDSRRAQGAPRSATVTAAEPPAWRAADNAVENDDPAPPFLASSGRPPGGLRRLAAIAGAETTGWDPAPAALPAAAHERLEEAELGRRIGRLLRREAERQGIDLAGVLE